MTIKKFGRNYRLTIYPVDGGSAIIITFPLTINFTCNRNINSSVNTLSLDIYNLSESNRRRIFQDIMVLGQYASGQVNADGVATESHNILLEAGYGNLLYRVFYGRMMQASTAREGNNLITRIEATSTLSDIAGTQTQISLQAGQTVGQILNYLIQQFPNLKLGAIGSFPIVMNSPAILNGNVWELLKKYSNGQVFEDNGNIYVINNNEALYNTFTMDDSTGLLQTPRRQLQILTVTTLMETSVQFLTQQIQIKSVIQPEYNGTYRVNGIVHQGMISGAVSGNMRSIFTLQASGLFDGFTILNPTIGNASS